MSYIPKTISEVVSEYLNKTTFLPAIQREFVWNTYGIEKLFDSIMGDFPISTFLFWKIKEENKNEWTSYEFIRDYDSETPHNKEASVTGINQDIHLVLDGQQRLTSLFIGLKGTYRYFYYRWYKSRLYLNILKEPLKSDNPEEFTYQFQFRENDLPNSKDSNPQYWYLVGDILNFDDAEDAKKSIKAKLAAFSDDQKDIANTHIGRLHWISATSRRTLRIMAALLFAHAVAGFVGSFFFPMHSRGMAKTMTLTDTMHIVSTGIEVLPMLLAIGFGAAAFGKRFRRYSIGTILLLLLGGTLAGLKADRVAAGLATPWMGVTERMNIYAFMLWTIVLTIALLRTDRRQSQLKGH